MNEPVQIERPPNGHRILVVDDEGHAREVVGLALEVAGFEVLFAVDGRDGLERTLQELPDLVLTDIHMPRMDGNDLAREVANRMGPTAPPVVGFTADRDAVETMRERDVFQAVLRKPVSPSALISLVRSIVTPEGAP